MTFDEALRAALDAPQLDVRDHGAVSAWAQRCAASWMRAEEEETSTMLMIPENAPLTWKKRRKADGVIVTLILKAYVQEEDGDPETPAVYVPWNDLGELYEDVPQDEQK